MQLPVLTIGIPTYNRSKLLDNLLDCIFKQLDGTVFAHKVQVVVSNNNSTDDTEEVVDLYVKKGLNLIYSRNTENIGANNNILKIGYELAQTPYCWIIGDDDLIRDGGIAYYLKVLEGNSDVELFYLNHTNELDTDRQLVIDKAAINSQKMMCSRNEDQLFPSGQPVLEVTTHNALFTALSSFIFKTEVWKEHFIGYQPYAPFTSVANTFPHTVVLSQNLMQKPVYYVAYPYLAFFVGTQGWLSNWTLLMASRVVELTDRFEHFGAGSTFLTTYRERVFADSLHPFLKWFTGRDLPPWYHINFIRYLFKYIKYKNFRRTVKKLFFIVLRIKLGRLKASPSL
ncbi:glycosyl transferase family 2 [Mucilaginibacter yixingensis]|uniref:Glycosyl transferase family 2 n=1 Tax=Mucilaginibacter yixingensis TaxID=1295612 RepID=A0A2T5JC69_9SPHI|nr:glycosyltransferase family A protein [Mucilaginibacter yixingensis]PTQ99361.1 glycosyl transferase family 2 [Mucilaginibacter yixingensis]